MAFAGDSWQWHQDFPFWNKEDGMPNPDAVSIMIYLSEATEFNGPLMVIPGSHKENIPASAEPTTRPSTGDWRENVSVDLKYTLNKAHVSAQATKNGIVSCKGQQGSILIFHPNLFHASYSNLSPWDRNALIVTYNSTENTHQIDTDSRPEFLVNRDTSPAEKIADDLI